MAPDTDPQQRGGCGASNMTTHWIDQMVHGAELKSQHGKLMNLANKKKKPHLGLGGTSPIFIRTPPEWPRDTAECRRRTHTVLVGSCEDAPPLQRHTHQQNKMRPCLQRDTWPRGKSDSGWLVHKYVAAALCSY